MMRDYLTIDDIDTKRNTNSNSPMNQKGRILDDNKILTHIIKKKGLIIWLITILVIKISEANVFIIEKLLIESAILSLAILKLAEILMDDG